MRCCELPASLALVGLFRCSTDVAATRRHAVGLPLGFARLKRVRDHRGVHHRGGGCFGCAFPAVPTLGVWDTGKVQAFGVENCQSKLQIGARAGRQRCMGRRRIVRNHPQNCRRQELRICCTSVAGPNGSGLTQVAVVVVSCCVDVRC